MIEVKTKKKRELKEFTGNLEQVATIKETRIPKRYSLKIKVNGRWFILFGTEEQLKRRVKPFEIGQQIKIRYTTSVFKDREYYTALGIKAIKQSSLEGENSNSPSSIEHRIKVIEDSLLLQISEIEQIKKKLGCN